MPNPQCSITMPTGASMQSSPCLTNRVYVTPNRTHIYSFTCMFIYIHTHTHTHTHRHKVMEKHNIFTHIQTNDNLCIHYAHAKSPMQHHYAHSCQHAQLSVPNDRDCANGPKCLKRQNTPEGCRKTHKHTY